MYISLRQDQPTVLTLVTQFEYDIHLASHYSQCASFIAAESKSFSKDRPPCVKRKYLPLNRRTQVACMGGDCSSNDKGNEEMGVCDSQEYESPFDAVFSRQIDLYKVEMHKNCVDFSALVTGIRNMLPEVWEHYDKNNDGALPH